MGSVLSDQEFQNLLDALESDSEKIQEKRNTEEIGEEELLEMIMRMGSVVSKKDIEDLLNAL